MTVNTHILLFGLSVLASSAVDHGFKLRSDQTKDHRAGICSFSVITTQHKRIIAKTESESE